MPILYVDNFRGFKRTFLPLQEINFFVGENSTGKSSILKLIGILSSQGFWRYNIFGEEETSLGPFSEIITMGSDKEFFEVAIIDEQEDNSDKICAFKFIFIEHEGFPLVKEIRYIDENIDLQGIIDGDFLKYRFETSPNVLDAFTNKLEFFKTWVSKPGDLSGKLFNREPLDVGALIQVFRQLQGLMNFRNESSEPLLIHLPQILNHTAWFAPTVAEPEKIYFKDRLAFDATGLHTPSLLSEILENGDVQGILEKFGTDSGLFEKLNIKALKNITEDAFELQVTLDEKKILNITNVGYGVSQILPFLLETIARPDGSWFASQQPETHLHPRAQAALGEFIYKSNLIDRQKFIIETHSDYTIDRLRLRINKDFKSGNSREDFCQVVFFNRSPESNNLTTIQIGKDGSYNEDQPDDFRDFFIKEQLTLIRI